MKKILLGLSLFAIVAVSATSCKKDKTTDCTSAIKVLTDAGTAYVSNMSSANCKTYKAALQDYLNSDCASSASAEQKAIFQETLNGLTCPE
jgi:hypothetical protein